MRDTHLSDPLLPRKQLISLLILARRLAHHLLRHRHAILALQIRARKPVAEVLLHASQSAVVISRLREDTHLVVAALRLAHFVLVFWPEARAVRRKDLVDEHDLLGDGILTEFEFGIGDDDAAGFGVVSGLEQSNQSNEPHQVTAEKWQSAHHLINPQTRLLHLRRHIAPHNLHRPLPRDILIVLSLLCLRARSPDRLLQPLTLPQTLRHCHPVHRAVLLVLGPCGAGDVAAHDGLKRYDGDAAYDHAAGGEGGGGKGIAEDVRAKGWEGGVDEVEPEAGELGQDGAFGGDALEDC